MGFRIAIQLWSVREECSRDLEATLRSLGSMGFEGVEFAGFYGREAGELRKILEGVGLKAVSSHIPYVKLVGEEFHRTVEYALELGLKSMIIPSLPKEMRSTRTSWIEFSNMLNALSDQMPSKGLRIGYHSHDYDFKAVGDLIPWHYLSRSTRRSVILQLDTANALMGGVEPSQLLDMARSLRERLHSVHVKDYTRRLGRQTILGEGDVPWRDLLRILRHGGTEWLILEQEYYPSSPLDSIRASLKNLLNLLETL